MKKTWYTQASSSSVLGNRRLVMTIFMKIITNISKKAVQLKREESHVLDQKTINRKTKEFIQ